MGLKLQGRENSLGITHGSTFIEVDDKWTRLAIRYTKSFSDAELRNRVALKANEVNKSIRAVAELHRVTNDAAVSSAIQQGPGDLALFKNARASGVTTARLFGVVAQVLIRGGMSVGAISSRR